MASIKPKKPVKIVVDTNIIFSALLNSNLGIKML
jgi:predicted nucleic acid-binding protein